jgi:heat shock protein HslJ
MSKSVASAMLLCVLAACAQSGGSKPPAQITEAPQLAGTRWLAEAIDGKAVVPDVQSTLEFAGADRVSGRGGCNQYSGRALLSGNTVRFGALITTKMGCAQPLMDQEFRYLKALDATGTFRIDPDGRLVLVDESGAERLKFSRMTTDDKR